MRRWWRHRGFLAGLPPWSRSIGASGEALNVAHPVEHCREDKAQSITLYGTGTKGLSTRTPVRATSATFLVTSVRP
jgi:hypothetical protein